MRALLHIAMAALLLVSTTGMSTTSHYCGDFLMQVVVGSHDDMSCCGMMDCCTNEVEHQQVEDEFQQLDQSQDMATAYTFYYALPWAPANWDFALSTSESLIHLRAKAPPPSSERPLWLLTASFLC